MADSTILFEGDPRLFLGVDGSKIQFNDGQPIMDRGLENQALICLFTSRGWVGNIFFQDKNQQIGSDFEEEARKPITVASLSRVRSAALRALDIPAFGETGVIVTNPISYRLDVAILIQPPGGDISAFLLTKNGLNWTFQAKDPAHLRNGG